LDLHSASSLKQQSIDRHVASFGQTHYPGSDPTGHFSFSLMLRAKLS